MRKEIKGENEETKKKEDFLSKNDLKLPKGNETLSFNQIQKMYISIIHDNDETDNINDEYSTRRSDR